MTAARFIVATVFDGLASLPDDSVDLVLSSPPFLALRSYLPADHPTKTKEIGSEATPADFLDTLLDVVEACDRVLAPHGSLVFELGDTFAGSGGAGGDYGAGGLRDGQERFNGSAAKARAHVEKDRTRTPGPGGDYSDNGWRNGQEKFRQVSTGRESSWSHTDAVWLAAVVDAEGAIFTQVDKRDEAQRHTPAVTVAMHSEEVVNRIANITGVGTPRRKGDSLVWSWSAFGQQARYVLLHIWPYLMVKQEHAKAAIEMARHIEECRNGRGKPVTAEQIAYRETIRRFIMNLNEKGGNRGRYPSDWTPPTPHKIKLGHGGSGWPESKSLTGIPTLFAWSLAYGRNLLRPERTTDPWRIRNVVAWCRPNPSVGALGDKFRTATSYLTVATKSRTRYFDLEPVRKMNHPERMDERSMQSPRDFENYENGNRGRPTGAPPNPAGAPPLDWWEIPTAPYKGSHYACVDADTEALTPRGWRRHDQLRDGDLIAAYDHNQGVVVWQSAEFHRYSYNGPLVAIDKRETSQRLTPNHRTLVRSRDSDPERVVEAADLLPSHRLPVAAPFDLPPALDDPGPRMAELLGWYVTEGSQSGRSVRIYQSATINPDNCERIRRLLLTERADYSERSRLRVTLSPRIWEEVTWTVRGDMAAWLIKTAPAKRLSATVTGWSEESCSALLAALIAGDGHARASGRRAFIQKDRDTVDAVQALVCRLGLRSTISRRQDGQWSLTIGERRWLSLRGTNGKSNPVGRVHYTGTVWCPSVPSTFWLARRDGRPFITGNTWPPDLLVKPILSMCPEKVCRVCGEPSRRITETVNAIGKATGRRSWRADPENIGNGHSGAIIEKISSAPTADVRTLGWTDCGCGAFRPGLVLDPFAGSGTTLTVATGHGRDAVGIDLDERNAELARQRVGMFLEVDVLAPEVPA